MKPYAVEFGTFWVSDSANGLPPKCSARVETTFEELGIANLDALQVAMNLPSQESIHQRLQNDRRCFGLKIGEQIVAYGWVTRGVESVGELERDFHLYNDEVYVWDCGTVPAWRGKRCYSALLSHLIHQFHQEGVPRIWIGASRQNQPSIQGIIHAGFQHIIDLIYKRYFRLTFLQFYEAPAASSGHLMAAYRILLNHEWRLGQFAIGYKRD